ncbi:MAG: hypothetical protein ABEK02_03605 [Haloquadratum sp.]
MRETLRAALRTADPRQLGGDYSVVALGVVALAVILAGGIVGWVTDGTSFVAGIASGATLALAVRMLAADRTLAMPVGGLLAPLGATATLAAPAHGFLRGGLVTAGTVASAVVLGLGLGLVVVQSFARNRTRRASSRHLVGTLAFGVVSALAVLLFAGSMSELFAVVGTLVSTAAGELGAASRPGSTAGPTLLLAAVGLFATGAALDRLSLPTVVTSETRKRTEAASERGGRVLRRAGLIAVLLGGFFLVTDATGTLPELVVSLPFFGPLLAVIGSAAVRQVTVAIAVLGVGSFLALSVAEWLRSLTIQQIAVATLPTLGLFAGAVVVTVASSAWLPAGLDSIPVVGDSLADAVAADPAGVAVLLGGGSVIGSTLTVTGLHVLARTISQETPGTQLVGVGVAAVGVVVLATTSAAVPGFVLFALAVFVVDVGSYGWTVGSDVGRRSGTRAELLHGLASALVGWVGIAIATSLVGIATADGPRLSLLQYAAGTAAVAIVFLTIGRQMPLRR